MTDEDDDRRDVDPEEFETFDHYDPDLDPPEVEDDDEEPAVPRGVAQGAVLSTVGVLRAAYNRR